MEGVSLFLIDERIKNEKIYFYFAYERPKEFLDLSLNWIRERIKNVKNLFDMELVCNDLQQFKKFTSSLNCKKEFSCVEFICKKFPNFLKDIQWEDFELHLFITECDGFLHFYLGQWIQHPNISTLNFKILQLEDFFVKDLNIDSFELLNALITLEFPSSLMDSLLKNLTFLFSLKRDLSKIIQKIKENSFWRRLVEKMGMKIGEYFSYEILMELLNNSEDEIDFINHLYVTFLKHFNQFSKK
jgi:hypothetical protein